MSLSIQQPDEKKLLHKTKQNILHVSLSIQRPDEKKLLNNKTKQNKIFYMWV